MIDYIELFDELLNTAGQYNGIVFGPYVNDVIIPKMNNEHFYSNGKQMNIWFKNSMQIHQFIRDVNHFNLIKIKPNVYEVYHNHACILNLIIGPPMDEEYGYMYVNGDKNIVQFKNN